MGPAIFLMKELVQNKDIYRTANFLKQVLLHSNNFFKTDTFSTKVFFKRGTPSHGDIIHVLLLYYYYNSIFQKSNILHYLIILESHFFGVGKS